MGADSPPKEAEAAARPKSTKGIKSTKSTTSARKPTAARQSTRSKGRPSCAEDADAATTTTTATAATTTTAAAMFDIADSADSDGDDDDAGPAATDAPSPAMPSSQSSPGRTAAVTTATAPDAGSTGDAESVADEAVVDGVAGEVAGEGAVARAGVCSPRDPSSAGSPRSTVQGNIARRTSVRTKVNSVPRGATFQLAPAPAGANQGAKSGTRKRRGTPQDNERAPKQHSPPGRGPRRVGLEGLVGQMDATGGSDAEQAVGGADVGPVEGPGAGIVGLPRANAASGDQGAAADAAHSEPCSASVSGGESDTPPDPPDTPPEAPRQCQAHGRKAAPSHLRGVPAACVRNGGLRHGLV